MSQNLALDNLDIVSSSNSDVSGWLEEEWYESATPYTTPTQGSTSNTGTAVWNLGSYIIINPTATTACSSNNTGLSACSGQFMAVGSRTASTDPNFYQKNGATYTSTEYDAHYLAGNYYQWNAATAGTGGTITSANASGSICPKNWKLPSSGNNTTKGTFGYLLSQYGVASSLSGTSSANSNTYNIALSPLFFVRGGSVYLSYPSEPFRWAGSDGYYWSSRAYSSTTSAYFLSFGSSSVYPSNVNSRFLGDSLRCLIPTT